MKRFGSVLALILTLTIALPALAVDPVRVFAGTGTDVGNTICYYVASANSVGLAPARVTFLSATSDKAGAIVQFYSVDRVPTQVTGANTTVTIPVASSIGFANGDVVIIRHVATDTYEKRIMTTGSASTTLVLTVAPTTATAAGDLVYEATAAGTMPVGAATINYYGGGLYYGQAGYPLLLEIDGTSSCQINAVGGDYVQ